MLPVLLAYAVGLIDRGGLKSAFIRSRWAAAARKTLERWTATVRRPSARARRLSQTRWRDPGSTRAMGDHLVLLSASTDLYVPAIGAALGFDEVICTGRALERRAPATAL